MDFDDAPDESLPQQPAPQQASQDTGSISFDDAPDESEGSTPQPASSAGGAFVRQAARGVVPNIAGAVGGLAGAGAGIEGGPVGAIAGGIAGSYIASAGAQAAQDKILDAMVGDNPDQLGGVASKTQAQADVQQHPYWSELGGLAPAVLSFNLAGAGGAAARLVNAGIMGGIDVASQEATKGDVDWTQAGIAAGAGLALGKPRDFVAPAEEFGARAAQRIRGGSRSQVQAGDVTGRPNVTDTPDAAADRAETDAANDIEAVAIGATNDNVAQTNTAITPTVTDPAATISVTRNAEDYAKTGPTKAPQGGVPGAPSTVIQTDGNVSQDVSAALAPKAPEAAAPAEAQTPHVPDQTPPPELDGLQATNGQPPRVQQGQMDQPLSPDEETSPLGNPGRPGANNGLPTLHGVPLDVPPHVADVISLPQVKDAIDNGAIKNNLHVPGVANATAGDDATTNVDRSIPKIAVLPSGNRFEPQKAAQIHEQVEKFVQGYLTEHGMPETSAFKVAHWDFAEPAEAAYYKGLGIDPVDAQSWWARQGRNIEQSKDQTQPEGLMAKPVEGAPHEHYTTDDTAKPTPEEQAQASILMRQPAPEGEAKPVEQAKPAAPAAEEPKVEAAARPAEVDRAVSALRAKGMNDRADQLEAMEPAQQLIGSMQINKQMKNATTRQKLGNVTVRSSKDLARKQGALDATQSAFEKFPPPAEGESPGGTLMRAKAMVDHATAQYNNQDPIAGYKPREKPAGWQLVQAAQRALKNPSKVKDFLAKEATLRMDNPETAPDEDGNVKMGQQSPAELEQETKRIESDIALNKKPETGDVENARQAEAMGSTPRVTFPDVPQDTTAIAEDRQMLHDYINGLSDDDYRKLENVYRDPANPEAQSFQRVVDTSSNPYKLHLQMESELEGANQPGNLDHINAMDEGLPVTKREKVLAGPPPKPSDGAAGALKLRKDLIAEYNNKLKNGDLGVPDRVTPEERIAQEQEAANPKDIPSEAMIPKVARSFASMLRDTSGALHLPLSWMIPQRGNAASPNAAPSTKEVADSLGKDLRIHLNKLSNEESKVRLNANQAIARNLSPEEWEKAYNGIEDRNWGNMPNKISDAVRENWVPLRDQLKDTLDTLRVEAPHLDIPPDFPGVEKSFLSRMRSGLQSFDRDRTDDNDPVVHLRTLTDYAGPLQPRDFFTLTDGAGKRMVMSFDPDKSALTIYRNGAPQIIKNVPNTFKGELGDVIGLKQQGTVTPFTVDHAKAQEIEDNVKQWANPNAPLPQLEPLKYLKNPIVATSNALLRAKTVLANTRMVDKLTTDPRILDNSTTDKDVAKKEGYITEPTLLEQMRTRGGKIVYYAPQIKYALDDFAKRGFNIQSLNSLKDAATGLTKVMYTFGPLVHILNEGNLWGTSRGFDWLRPQGWHDLVTTGLDAIKSVTTQDDFQRQMRENDASLMLPNVLNRDLMRAMVTNFNMQVTREPSILDPLSKLVGTDVPTLANHMYDNSSKLMWYASDIMLTQRTKELMKQGMSMPDAIQEAHHFISDYHVNGTTLGSRALSQFYSDPTVSLFGPYHIGIWRSYSHIISRVITGTPQQKLQAASQAAVGVLMAYYGYPALDELSKYVTGDDTAEFGRRGLNTIPRLINQIKQGDITGKDLSAISPYIATLSMPVQTAIRALANTDFTGKKIVPTNNYDPLDSEGRKNIGQAAAAETDFAAKNLVSPYNQLSSALTKENSPGAAAAKFFASLFGVSTKSPQAEKFLNKEPKNVRMQEKAREKRPPGVLEELYNKSIGR